MFHTSTSQVYLTANLSFVFPFVVLWYETVTSATGRLIEGVLPRLSSPRTMARWVLTATAYMTCLLTNAAALPLGAALMGVVRANYHLAPEWRIPADDGLDPETRRFAKHFLVVAYYMFGTIGYFRTMR